MQKPLMNEFYFVASQEVQNYSIAGLRVGNRYYIYLRALSRAGRSEPYTVIYNTSGM